MSIEKPKKLADLDDRPAVPRNPDIENQIEGIYSRNYFARTRRDALIAYLNSSDFREREDGFRQTLDSWNENEGNTKGFDGQYSQIENIRGTHGTLAVYHFPSSDAIKFGFSFQTS